MKNLTEVVCILDKSGSMSGVILNTIEGYNKFIEQQKELPGEVLLTTVLFDHHYELVFDRVPLRLVPKMTTSTYRIGGTTALNDAVGRTIYNLSNKILLSSDDKKPDKVLFLIITDGLENASREFNTKQIQELVTEKRESYGWEFIFLGANIDSFAVGQALGIAYTANFVQDSKGINNTYNTLNFVTRSFRTDGTIDKDWDKDLNSGS